MKRIAWLIPVVLSLTIMLNAADEASVMTGWVCDSKCIAQNGDKATCDTSCTERSGDAVFIDDQGKIFQISNSASWSQYMNKRVRGKGCCG